jgi:hypothetical protein
MTELQIESPLKLPDGWNRTPQNATVFSAQFALNVTIEDAVRYLEDEVGSLRANAATLHTNYSGLRNERTRSKQGQSEGAGLKLSVGATKAFLGCDKWRMVAQNIYALHLAVRHIRLFEEWGIATAEYMLMPFDTRADTHRNTHAPHDGKMQEHSNVPEWMEALGLGATATLGDANAVYRQRVKLVSHDEEAMIALNQAIERARQALAN